MRVISVAVSHHALTANEHRQGSNGAENTASRQSLLTCFIPHPSVISVFSCPNKSIFRGKHSLSQNKSSKRDRSESTLSVYM